MSTYTVILPRRRSLWPALRAAQLAFLLPLGVLQLAAVFAFVGTADAPTGVQIVVAVAAAAVAVAAIAIACLLPRRTFLVRDAAHVLIRAEIVVCLVTLIGFGQLAWLALLPVAGLASLALWLDERSHPSFI
jgi:hypothetical protein